MVSTSRVGVAAACALTLLAGYVGAVAAAAAAAPAAAAAVAAPKAAATSRFAVQVQASGAFTVMMDGAPYLQGAATWLHTQGRRYSTADKSLSSGGAPATYTGADATGDFTATRLTWSAGGVPFTTTFRVYADAVVFAQDFPKGAPGTAVGDKDAILSAFPAFHVGAAAGARGAMGPSANASTGFLAFAGDMTGDNAVTGVWGRDAVPDGISGTGPVVLFSSDLSKSAVLSPFTAFMAASQSYDKASGTLAYGCMGNVTELPAAFNLETVLVASSGGGINAAMDEWGDKLLARYGKTRHDKDADYTLSWLGYSTDNGAYYYYQTEPNKTYEQTMLDVKAYADKEALPYSYWLADSWWYYKGDGANRGGVVNWTAMTSVFPHNMSYVYDKTGWLVQGHNRFWSHETNYAKQNGGPWDFIIDADSGYAVPTQQAFWDWLLRESKKWGLTVYEQDWLDDEFDRVGALTQSATLARQWMLQMGHGAAKNGLTIQLCMSHVRHILQSVEMPAVSQARASGDYSENASEQWNVGTTGILAHAVGIAPSKDNYWSTTYQSGNRWGPGRFEPYNRLQAAAITLSAGPIAPSDKIGDSDRDLIMRSCTKQGRLLVPSRPGTHIDGYYARLAFGASAPAAPDGQVWTTGTEVSGRWYANVMAVELNSDYAAPPAVLGQVGSSAWAAAGVTLVGYEANSTSSIVSVTASAPLHLGKCDKFNFQFYNLAERRAGEWTLLGEPDKWIAVSAARFESVSVVGGADASTEVVLRGDAGETVTVNFLAPAAPGADGGGTVSVQCTLTDSLRARVSVPAKTCVSV